MGSLKKVRHRLVVSFGSCSGVIPASGGVVEVETAGAVQYLFWAADGQAGGQDLVFISTAAGQIQPETPVPGRPAVAQSDQWLDRAVS